MLFSRPLVRGRLVRREKRFLVHVELDDGRRVVAHTNNTGTMLGCNEPGSRVWLSPADDPKRKLKWTYELVEASSGVLVGINTILANKVVREGIEGGLVEALAGHDWLRAEVTPPAGGEGVGRSRIDFLLGDGPTDGPLEGPARRTWVEVKNVTLVGDGCALFPDAVTERGRKHLRELVRLVRAGDRAVMFYLVQRGDAERFAPAADIDPAYAAELVRARRAGVEALAWRADVSPAGIVLDAPIPVTGLD